MSKKLWLELKAEELIALYQTLEIDGCSGIFHIGNMLGKKYGVIHTGGILACIDRAVRILEHPEGSLTEATEQLEIFYKNDLPMEIVNMTIIKQ